MRACGCEVEVKARVLDEKSLRWSGALVGAEVVDHDVDHDVDLGALAGPTCRLHAGMTASPSPGAARSSCRALCPWRRRAQRTNRLSRDGRSGSGVRRSGRTEVHRQNRLSAFEGLDLRLLVDTQHDRVVGRTHVQPDDVADLLDEQRVLRQPDRFGPMWLQPKGSPDAADRRVAHSHILRHRPRAPVSPPTRGRLQRLGHDGFDGVVRDLAYCTRPRLVMQPVEAICNEPRSAIGRRSLDASAARGLRPYSNHHPRTAAPPSL